MELPINISQLIDEITSKVSVKDLVKSASNLSSRYMEKSKDGDSFFNDEMDVISYLNFRFPATYSAVYEVLNRNKEYLKDVNTVLDVGAGCGTASIAVNENLNSNIKYDCIEVNSAMIDFGKKFFSGLNMNVNYIRNDVRNNEFSQNYDLIITSYFLNELCDNDGNLILRKLWDKTNRYLVIIEPGTPLSHRMLLNFRNTILKLDGYIIGPCLHAEKCSLSEGDWCHFTTRVQRSKIHKVLKSGEAPFEDEKYSYIIFSKEKVVRNEQLRVLRHPMIYKGYVEIDGCFNNGAIQKIKYSKKHGELFKTAKKAKAGDAI